MNVVKSLLVGLLAVPFVAAQAREDGDHTVPVTVTGGSDRSVYLDHGRDVGLQVGTIVHLFAPGAAAVEAEIRAVSQTSARAELAPGIDLPPVGTHGEAYVTTPQGEPEPATPQSPKPTVPAHPPWSRQEGTRDKDQPLLVPTYSQRPDERPATLDGRLFGYGQWTRDRGDGRANDYLLARAGLRADATNYLGYGERTRLAGEFDERSVRLANGADEDNLTARLDLLSVAFGTEAWAATGVEVGRFYSTGLPEIGLVDGVEVIERFQGGLRVGGGVGSYPRPFPARDTGDDVGVHLFADYVADERRSFAAALGVQKTWHQGSADRDLLLLRVDSRPVDRMWLFASAKVDFYTGSDTIKGSGPELTELLAQARYDGSTAGAGVVFTRFSWPELKRAEYQFLPVELVRDGHVDRLSLTGSLRPWRPLSLRGRVDFWNDQNDNGTAYGLDVDWRGLFGTSSLLSASVFASDGGYSSGPGLRLMYRDRLGESLDWRVGYRWHRYDIGTLVSGSETYTRQSAELGLSTPISHSGDLDISLERWFGDGEDATSLGFYLQWRF